MIPVILKLCSHCHQVGFPDWWVEEYEVLSQIWDSPGRQGVCEVCSHSPVCWIDTYVVKVAA